MREPKNQMLGTMEPPLMQLSVNILFELCKSVFPCSCKLAKKPVATELISVFVFLPMG